MQAPLRCAQRASCPRARVEQRRPQARGAGPHDAGALPRVWRGGAFARGVVGRQACERMRLEGQAALHCGGSRRGLALKVATRSRRCSRHCAGAGPCCPSPCCCCPLPLGAGTTVVYWNATCIRNSSQVKAAAPLIAPRNSAHCRARLAQVRTRYKHQEALGPTNSLAALPGQRRVGVRAAVRACGGRRRAEGGQGAPAAPARPAPAR